MRKYRIAIICDYLEENWPSMDLVGNKLAETLTTLYNDKLEVTLVRPVMARFFNWHGNKKHTLVYKAERFWGRYVQYPIHVFMLRNKFDLFHIIDHSYAHLIHSLPADRVGVMCHDLEIFRCLIDKRRSRCPVWFKIIANLALSGLKKAKIIFCVSETIKKEIDESKLLEGKMLICAHNGVSVDYTVRSSETGNILGKNIPTRFILNVGSNAPRKKLDLLLEVFSKLHQKFNDLYLIQVGGGWTKDQRLFIKFHQLENSIQQYPFPQLSNQDIAALYRTALMTILTSEYEGFGIPLLEALACGCVVVASDIPVFHEIGGNAVIYCQINEHEDWVEKITKLLTNNGNAPPLSVRFEQSKQYSWEKHTNIIYQAYQNYVLNN